MTTEKKKPRINKVYLLLLIGLIAFIIYFVFIVDPASLANVIAQTNLAIFAAAFAAYTVGILFNSLVWHSLLNSLAGKINRKNAFIFTWVGLFFDATIPQLGVSGDVVKTYLYTKATDQNLGKVGASVVGHKILILTMSVISFSAGLIMVLLNYTMPTLTTISVIGFLAISLSALVIVFYVSFNPKATDLILRFIIKVISFFRKKWNPEPFQNKILETLTSFHHNVDQLKAKPKILIAPTIYQIISWSFDIAVVFLAFLAVGYSAPIDKVLIVYTITGSLQAVGIAIFGVNEIIMSLSFSVLGIPVEISFAATLLTRAVSLWFRLIVSYIALQWTGLKMVKNLDDLKLPI